VGTQPDSCHLLGLKIFDLGILDLLSAKTLTASEASALIQADLSDRN
jgi:hypothetical protein